MDKLRLLILYGGVSEEHDVSVKSARELWRHLDAEKYDPVCVRIGRDGLWSLADSPEHAPDGGAVVAPSTDPKNGGLALWKHGRCQALPVDVAFPMLHGKHGEDGAVQGALQMAGIPYVGCGIAASALCMDKALTYMVASAAGVRAPRHRVILGGDRDADIAAGELGYPLFVKPARSGSSFGVSKVSGPASLGPAVRAALAYDDKVLLEEAIEGLEIGCAVLGNGADLLSGALDQIELSGGFFHIHQEAAPEQGSENATIKVPAPIPEDARARVVDAARAMYRALGCRGLARVDMFLTPGGRVVLNEVNTMPGFTSYSRYPRMMAGAGIHMAELIDRLVMLALEGGAR